MAAKKLGIFSDPLLDRQIREIVTELTPGPWIAPNLLNDWVNYYNSSSYNPAGYYKHQSRVYLRGMIADGVITTSTTAFILPKGYRPPKRELFATICGGTLLTRVDITADGEVIITDCPDNAWVSLDGLSFRVAS